MIEHSNPCKAIKATSFLRKNGQPQELKKKIKFSHKKADSEGSKQNMNRQKQIKQGVGVRGQKMGHIRIASEHYSGLGQNSKHEQRRTMTDASSHIPIPNIFEGNMSGVKNIQKDLKFLRECYELVTSQNETLITHVSSRSKQINGLDQKIQQIRRMSMRESKFAMGVDSLDLDTIVAAESGEEQSQSNTPRRMDKTKSIDQTLMNSHVNRMNERRQQLLQLKNQLEQLNFNKIMKQ